MIKQNGKKRMIAIIVVLMIVVVTISVGYALISMTAGFSFSSVKQMKTTNEWKTCFVEGTSSTSCASNKSVSGTPSGTDTTNQVSGYSWDGRSCGTATVNNTTVTVAETKLSKPGDKCVWTLYFKNLGTISAKIKTLGFTNPKDGSSNTISCTDLSSNKKNKMQCGNIIYTLASNTSGTGVTIPDSSPLNPSGSKTYYLIAEFDSNKTEVSSSNVVQTTAKFTIGLTQS